jgi:hypothetical protein
VAEFLGTNPNFELGQSIDFLAAHYGQQEWVVEGGAAVHNLAGGGRPEPHDLDIVCRDPGMQRDFNGPNYFDIKSLALWMGCKGLEPAPDLWHHVMDTSIPATVAGADVRLMSPALIAAGKSFPYLGRPQRQKDILDIELLGVKPYELEAAKARMLGAIAL